MRRLAYCRTDCPVRESNMKSQTSPLLPNLGEGRCEMMTRGSRSCKRIVFQVADVHKPQLSISGCADMGFDCDLGDKGGHRLDTQSGEKIPRERRDNFYMMRAWIRQDPGVNADQLFARPEYRMCNMEPP